MCRIEEGLREATPTQTIHWQQPVWLYFSIGENCLVLYSTIGFKGLITQKCLLQIIFIIIILIVHTKHVPQMYIRSIDLDYSMGIIC